MSRHSFRRNFVIGGIVALVVGVFAATAAAANPHVESATASMAAPTVTSPGEIAWNAGLNVPFQLAGLGKNSGVAVTLSAVGAVRIVNTHAGSLTVNQGTAGSGSSITLLNDVFTGSVTLTQFDVSPNLTTDKNGAALGTLTVPTEIDMSSITSACIQVAWTSITLTVGGSAVSLPDVSQTYDPTGTACAA